MEKFALINGKVYQGQGRFVEALYAEDGVIKLTGTNRQVLDACGDIRPLDCRGKTVIPGLNDSHMHLMGVGVGMYEANITGVTSVEEMVQRVRDFLRDHPERCKNGIHSVGWNQDSFTKEKRMPTRHDLDQISTQIPIVLERVCGHVATGNTRAVQLMGVTKDSAPDLFPGGTWETEADGTPNGIFTENAAAALCHLLPSYTPDVLEEMFLQAADYALAHGVTSVQSNDAGSAWASREVFFSLLKKLYDQEKCPLRYRYQISFPSPEVFEEYCKHIRGPELETGRLKLGPIKLFKDGSLGGRTALMRQDYQDDPGNRGVETITNQEMADFCRVADRYGIQVVTHVIGDKAVEDTVACYEQVLRDGKNPLRHGLVHCQITDRPLLERIAKDDILVMYQPIFLDYDMHAVTSRCGEALSSTSYAFRTMAQLGGHVSYGTDSPVEDCNPFPNLYSAVARQDQTGWPEGGFFPQERVTVEEAVDAYTIGSAYNEFQEDTKGRLLPGYLADLAVLDTDIFTCPPAAIRDTLPVATVVGGRVVWEK